MQDFGTLFFFGIKKMGDLAHLAETLENCQEPQLDTGLSTHDEVRGALTGLNELVVHWLDLELELPTDPVRGSTPLHRVAAKATFKAHSLRSRDEDPEIKKIAETRIRKNQRSLDDEKGTRLKAHRLFFSRVGGEVINRNIDPLPFQKGAGMLGQQGEIDARRMIEID